MGVAQPETPRFPCGGGAGSMPRAPLTPLRAGQLSAVKGLRAASAGSGQRATTLLQSHLQWAELGRYLDELGRELPMLGGAPERAAGLHLQPADVVPLAGTSLCKRCWRLLVPGLG